MSPTDPPGRIDPSGTKPAGAGDIAGPLRAWCGLGFVLLARVYRAMLLTLVVAAVLPTAWSWSSYVVRSGSMEPAVSVGDVVITTPFSTSSPVPVGRVMLFTPPDTVPGHEHRLHRVIENLGDGTYVTAGDANPEPDAAPVPAASFDGRAVICVPFVGLPLVWLNDGNMALLVSWALATMIAFYFSSRPSCRARHRRRDHAAPPPDRHVSDETPRPSAGLAALRTVLRPGSAVAGAAIVMGAAVTLPVGSADAAFSATTVSAASTWKVAVNTSRASSRIQVYDTPSSSGWYQRGTVAVNIYATANGGATIRSITYRVNGGSPVTIKTASLVFSLSTQGDNTITYFATDSFGASETAHTEHIKLDNRSPVLTVTSTTGDMTHAQWRTACAGLTAGVCGTVVDPIGSGVEVVEYSLFRSSDSRCFNGKSWSPGACHSRTAAQIDSGTWFADIPDSALESARTWYTITIYTQDRAGNTTNTTRNFSVG